MGWFTSFEIEFETFIDWDDNEFEDKLKDDDIVHDVEFMYLRDFERPRLITCVYSHTRIQDIVEILHKVYKTPMKYRVYGEEIWRPYDTGCPILQG